MYQYTPPNSEIICSQNVSTKVVCGIILFFKRKAMPKIWKKSWVPFRSYLLNSTANLALPWVFVFFKHNNQSLAAVYYAKCTIHCKCGFPIPCPWTFVYLKGKRCILNWPVARLRTFFCQITNTHLISMLYTVRLNYAECYFELHKLFWCIAYYQGPLSHHLTQK